jgi:predicted Zn-dependent protease
VKPGFFELSDTLCAGLHGDELLLNWFSGERSEFVRFNAGLVRQAGTVEQRFLSMRLVRARRQASAIVTLAGDASDVTTCREALTRLRVTLNHVPEDPWLLYSDEPRSTLSERRGRMPDAQEVIARVSRTSTEVGLVGFYAAGPVYRGFANSLGQRNWHEVDVYNFDWSLHLEGNKAVKGGYAGSEWDAAVFEAKLTETAERLRLMREPARSIRPGEYRAYLAPQALEEITSLLQLDSFSVRSRATRQSALMRMERGENLSPHVTIAERTAAGMAPCFQEDGYIRPGAVTLIDAGRPGASLVSPRSAREYGLTPNGANARESPESLDVEGGELADEDVLAALDTGLYVGNLWYLNFSDKAAGRITGMTRFATFWVEDGRIVAPVTPLRFDDTVYRMLGSNLESLTRSRELLLSTSTYDERSTTSSHLPGVLLSSLRFTL